MNWPRIYPLLVSFITIFAASFCYGNDKINGWEEFELDKPFKNAVNLLRQRCKNIDEISKSAFMGTTCGTWLGINIDRISIKGLRSGIFKSLGSNKLVIITLSFDTYMDANEIHLKQIHEDLRDQGCYKNKISPTASSNCVKEFNIKLSKHLEQNLQLTRSSPNFNKVSDYLKENFKQDQFLAFKMLFDDHCKESSFPLGRAIGRNCDEEYNGGQIKLSVGYNTLLPQGQVSYQVIFFSKKLKPS